MEQITRSLSTFQMDVVGFETIQSLVLSSGDNLSTYDDHTSFGDSISACSP